MERDFRSEFSELIKQSRHFIPGANAMNCNASIQFSGDFHLFEKRFRLDVKRDVRAANPVNADFRNDGVWIYIELCSKPFLPAGLNGVCKPGMNSKSWTNRLAAVLLIELFNKIPIGFFAGVAAESRYANRLGSGDNLVPVCIKNRFVKMTMKVSRQGRNDGKGEQKKSA